MLLGEILELYGTFLCEVMFSMREGKFGAFPIAAMQEPRDGFALRALEEFRLLLAEVYCVHGRILPEELLIVLVRLASSRSIKYLVVQL